MMSSCVEGLPLVCVDPCVANEVAPPRERLVAVIERAAKLPRVLPGSPPSRWGAVRQDPGSLSTVVLGCEVRERVILDLVLLLAIHPVVLVRVVLVVRVRNRLLVMIALLRRSISCRWLLGRGAGALIGLVGGRRRGEREATAGVRGAGRGRHRKGIRGGVGIGGRDEYCFFCTRQEKL